MILRLRHAVPWLQKFSGWSVCTAPPPLPRRFGGTAWTSATLAPSASDTDSQPPDNGGSGLPPTGTADSGPEKKKRRSTRGTKASAAAEAENLAGSAGDAEGDAAASSSQVTAPKRRTSTRRKAAAGSSDAAEPPSAGGAAGTADEAAVAVAPAKRTRRKKQEEAPPPAAEAAPPADADAEARRSSGAEASSSSGGGGDATSASTTKKSASRGTSKRAVAEKTSAAEVEERISIQSLPYEDFLVLPRKAEQVLIALGLRTPHHGPYGAGVSGHPAAAAAVGAGAAGPSAPDGRVGGGGSISNILELASYLGNWVRRPDPKELLTPLLIAQYQDYLGPSPDYLYDLFYLDYDPPYLASDAVRAAAVAAARSVSRASGVLSAKGSPPEALARAARDQLLSEVGEAAVAAQEARAPRLTELQLELFLLDWASARLTGLGSEGGIPYKARRCAALQLTRPIVLERLHRYAVKGESLQQLATGGGGRTVRLSQPMDALIEGLKAGVRMEPERLMADFRLTSPGSPMAGCLEEVQRVVVLEASRSSEPGSSMYYSHLVETLLTRPDIRAALRQQEGQWAEEQGEGDGSALTLAQVRLLFHLCRLERLRGEEQTRLRKQAEGAAAGGMA